MSDTPRTDKSEARFSSLCNPEDAMWTPSKIARQLERENAKLREDKARLDARIAELEHRERRSHE